MDRKILVGHHPTRDFAVVQAALAVQLLTSDRSYGTRPSPAEEPQMTYEVGRGLWVLRGTYQVMLPTGERLTIPRGFACDLASIPRVLWFLVGPHELSMAAALVHDFLYWRAGEMLPGEFDGRRAVSRQEADDWFLAIMDRQGVAPRLAWLAFWAVRLFAGRWPVAYEPEPGLETLGIGAMTMLPATPPLAFPRSKFHAALIGARVMGWIINRRRSRRGKDLLFPVQPRTQLGDHL